MQDLTINQLIEQAQNVCAFLRSRKGYDTARFGAIRANEHEVTFILDVMDDFQQDAPYDMRYKAENHWLIHLTGDETLYGWATALPSRAEREIRFTIRQLAPLATASKHIKDLEVESIMQGILGANASLQNLLEHDQALDRQARNEADSEVPF